MSSFTHRLLCSAVLSVGLMTMAVPASAADVKMVGVVEKIQMATDGKSAQATLKDSKPGPLATSEATGCSLHDWLRARRSALKVSVPMGRGGASAGAGRHGIGGGVVATRSCPRAAMQAASVRWRSVHTAGVSGW